MSKPRPDPEALAVLLARDDYAGIGITDLIELWRMA